MPIVCTPSPGCTTSPQALVQGWRRRPICWRRHGHTDHGLQERARVKLIEVEERIADLEVIRDTLREAIDAGCDDLITCAGQPCCPLPFTELARRDHQEPPR